MASDVKVIISADSSEFEGSLKSSAKAAQDFAQKIGASGKGVDGMKSTLRKAKTAVMDLALAYHELSEEAKKSDFGKQLKEQLDNAKKSAKELIDMQGDLNKELSNMASDTAGWDALKEGFSAAGNAGTALIGLFGSISGESETAAETLKLMATAQATLNAVITVGNALQKQSALMTGIANLQAKAAAKAKEMEAVATGKATVAQRLFNAVAKANPYVLLASAVMAVGGALIAFASSSADAKKREEEMQKETEKNKKLTETYSNSVVENSAEMIVKIHALSQAIQEEGKTQEDKNRIYEAAKPIADALGESVQNYADVENWISTSKDKIVTALTQRAIAMANYAVAIDLAKEKIRELAERETAVKAAARYVGQTAPNLDIWAQRGVDPKYLKDVYEKRDVFSQGEMTQQEVHVGYKLDQEGYNRMMTDLRKQNDELNRELEKSIKERIERAMNNENASKAILGSAGSPKTQRRTGTSKQTKEQLTALEKINKELDEEQKKLENITRENDKDGKKRQAVYAEIVRLNREKEKFYDVDDGGFEKLKNILKEQLKYVKAEGKEWKEIRNRIREANDDRLLYIIKEGNGSLQERIDLLEENLMLTEKGTDDYKETNRQLEKAKQLQREMNRQYMEGQLGSFEELIGELEEQKLSIDINADGAIQSLLELTDKIAKLTTEKAILDEVMNQYDFSKFSKTFDELFEKYKDKPELTIAIKTVLDNSASEKIAVLRAQFESGIINYDKFKTEWDQLVKYMESKGVRTDYVVDDFIENLKSAVIYKMKGVDLFGEDGLIDDTQFSKLLLYIGQFQARLEGLNIKGEQLMNTLYEAGAEAFNKLKDLYDKGFIDSKTYDKLIEELKEKLAKIGMDFKFDKEAEGISKGFQDATDAINSFGSAMSSLGDAADDPALKVAGVVASAIANIALGAGKAIAQAGDMGPWGWIAFGAAIMAELAAMVSQIHSITGYAEGGIIGGKTTMGDQVLARVNAGEMILNPKQQSNLFDMINSGVKGEDVTVASTVRVKGSDLYLALKNYNKTTGKKV